MSTRRSFALASGIAALALFVTTLAPGLIAIEDTPKFQFVGRVLGTAHPPGYPLYVVLSHVFGLLPIGNLAWRVNLLSAIFAASTVVLYALAAIEIGVAAPIAACGGLALATGSGFWFSATIAEVYSLHGTLVAAMVYALCRWRRTGRSAWFFAAIGAFSLGLGHHTSIVTLGPAVALFAIMVAPRFALAPRTVASILGLFALGFSQYLFVLVRTRQGVWGESPASTLPELIEVIRGARWTAYLAPPTVATLTERLPGVLERLAAEVSWPAALVGVVGVGVLARRDRPSLALVLGSMLGVIGFSTFFSGQTDGFLQPAFVLAWLLAAIGIDGVVRHLPVPRRYPGAIGAVALAGVAIWHGVANLEARDLSHRRFDMRYFDALSSQLPPHSGLMAEDFLVDRMVLYEKFSGTAFATRDIVAPVEAVPDRVREYADMGYGLFAFTKTAGNLRRDGFVVDYAMWPLEYGTLRQYLADQPRGAIVAIAIPAMRQGAGVPNALGLDVIGAHAPGPAFANLAAIGVVGGGAAARAERPQSETASVFAGRGAAVGGGRVVSPTDILADTSYDRASIRIGAREIVRSREPVVAVWSPRGELVSAFALNASGRVPMPDSPVSVHRVRGPRPWTSVGSQATELTGLGSGGHVMIRQADAGSPLVIYAGRRERPLAPRLYDVPASFGDLSVESFEGSSDALRSALTRDGWTTADADLLAMRHVYRIVMPAATGVFHLGLGGLPDRLSARWSAIGDAPAVSAIDLTGQLEPIDETTMRLHVARDHHQLFLAGGWSPISADETGGFAQLVAEDAEILLPCEPGACATLDAQLWAERDGGSVTMRVNGQELNARPLHSNWQYYRWNVPAAALRAGINSVVIRAEQPVRLADVLVSRAR